jgi:hypothetical protein
MVRSRLLTVEQLEDRTAPAVLNVPAAPYVEPDANLPPPPVQTFVTGALGGGAGAELNFLQVVDGQQFHFILSATGGGAPGTAGANMTVSDASGRVVFALAASGGTSWDGDVVLGAGFYTVAFTASGSATGPVGFTLSGWGLWGWGWLGPQLHDTTQQPLEPSAAASLPMPTSFFFLPENATDLFTAATASRGSSFLSPGSKGLPAPGAGFAPVGAVAPAPQHPDAGVPIAGAGVAGDSGKDQAEPAMVSAAPELLPAPVSRVVRASLTVSAPAEPLPGESGAPVEPADTTGAAPPEPRISAVAEAAAVPVVGTTPVSSARLLWSLGMATAVLSSLAMSGRSCVVFLRPRLRLALRKRPAPAPAAS